MTVKVIKDERNVNKKEEGNYIFEHILVHEMGQSNVNSLVASHKADKENAERFIKNFEDTKKEMMQYAKETLGKKKKDAEEFLEMLEKGDKQKIAMDYLNKIIETKKELIDNFQTYVEEQNKMIENILLPQKIEEQKKLDGAIKTLKIWEQYYDIQEDEQKDIKSE